MAHRDELEAALSRITALEQENRRLQKRSEASSTSGGSEVRELFLEYLDHVRAEVTGGLVNGLAPDHELMVCIERHLEIPQQRIEEFRRELIKYVNTLAFQGKRAEEAELDPRLQRALEAHLACGRGAARAAKAPGLTGRPSLWEHNRRITAAKPASQGDPVGLLCPRCEEVGDEVELVRANTSTVYSERSLVVEGVVCPRCLWRGDMAVEPR